MPLGVFDWYGFMQKQYKLEEGIMCPSYCLYVHTAGVDLTTATALQHSSTTHSQVHSSKAFLAFKCPVSWRISVFPWSISDSFLLLVCVGTTDLCAGAASLWFWA